MIELKHLRLVLALREYKNLTYAARNLYLTQSALSHQLRQLEEYFAAKIYIRKSTPIFFTDFGERLLELADKVIPLVEKTEHGLVEQKKQVQQEKLLVYTEFYGSQALLYPALKKYGMQFPLIYIEHIPLLDSVVTALVKHRNGVGLLATSQYPAIDPAFIYEPICSYELVALLPENHPLLAKNYLSISDFLAYPLICFSKRLDAQDIFHAFLDPADARPQLIQVHNMTSMIHSILMNKGIATIPSCFLSDQVPQEMVRSVKIGAEGIYGTVYVVTHIELSDYQPIDALVTLLRART